MKAGGKLKILIAIIIFSAIILIHELGHFLLAKLNGISVTEFSLGMGPRLFSVQKGETRYSVKLLPLGGSCAMVGEDTAEEELPGSFNAAPVWGRISVVAAGPVFNFILAFILSVIIVGFVGYDPAEIVEVQQDSAASEAGLEAGDVITEYNGYHVDLAKDLYVYSYLNSLNEGDTVTLKVRRDGETKEIQYTPDVSVRYLLGFNRSDASSMTVESLIEGMPLEAAGLQHGVAEALARDQPRDDDGQGGEEHGAADGQLRERGGQSHQCPRCDRVHDAEIVRPRQNEPDCQENRNPLHFDAPSSVCLASGSSAARARQTGGCVFAMVTGDRWLWIWILDPCNSVPSVIA